MREIPLATFRKPPLGGSAAATRADSKGTKHCMYPGAPIAHVFDEAPGRMRVMRNAPPPGLSAPFASPRGVRCPPVCPPARRGERPSEAAPLDPPSKHRRPARQLGHTPSLVVVVVVVVIVVVVVLLLLLKTHEE